MDKIFNLEHVFDKDFGPFFRKFWGFGGFLGPVNKKEGKAFHCAQYIFMVDGLFAQCNGPRFW